jgi:hypothetical protein
MMDLETLHTLHPELPDFQANALKGAAAIALQRREHVPGAKLLLKVGANTLEMALTWDPRSGAHMLDEKRVTEDGAECVALAIVAHHRHEWQLVRRLQPRKREGADWLVQHRSSGQEILLEISGTDKGPFEPRVRTKRSQAALAAVARGGRPAVSVVRFLEPRAMLED